MGFWKPDYYFDYSEDDEIEDDEIEDIPFFDGESDFMDECFDDDFEDEDIFEDEEDNTESIYFDDDDFEDEQSVLLNLEPLSYLTGFYKSGKTGGNARNENVCSQMF